MSSFVRRIQRQVLPTNASRSLDSDGKLVIGAAPPRKVHYQGRGKWLGLSNPKAKDLLARQRREARRTA